MKHFSALFPASLLAFLLLTLHLPAQAQAPVWQSAQAIALASRSSQVTATAVDAVGNVYLAGNFTNSMVVGGTTLTSLGGDDVFVAKFSPASNQFVWAQRAGGTGSDYATALAVSGTNVYVAGYFFSLTAGFGGTNLPNAGSSDVFVAKLTDAGNTGSFAWAQRAGGTAPDYTNAMAVSGTSVYVAGNFDSAVAGFGTTNLTNVGGGSSDVFVAKLTDAGNTGSFAWAQRAGGPSSDGPGALAVSGTSVYVAGDFGSPTAGFGPTTLTTAGLRDVFVAKLTDAGNTGSFVWAQRAGGTGTSFASALAVRGNSVYAAGYFNSSTADFGTTNLTNAGGGSSDVFVAKLTDAGNTGSFTWAKQAGGTGDDGASALAVNGTSVYVGGNFSSLTAGFGGTNLANAGAGDVFVAKLTDAGLTGSFAWAQQAGSTNRDEANALVVSGTSLYMAGSFSGIRTAFGNNPLTNSDPNPGTLGFLAALTDPTLTATATGRVLAPAQLYPNPARRTVSLRLPNGMPPVPLTITDALGRAVRHYPAPAGPEAVLDLGGLPAGLYLLRWAGPAQRLLVE